MVTLSLASEWCPMKDWVTDPAHADGTVSKPLGQSRETPAIVQARSIHWKIFSASASASYPGRIWH